MYRFRSIKYIATTAVLTAILIASGYASTLIQVPGLGLGYLQIADMILLPLIYIIPGPMTLFAGPIALSIADMIGGYFIFLPITISTRILMFLIIKIFNRKVPILSFLLAVLPIIILYPPYTFLISNFDIAKLLNELIIDAIQVPTTYVFSLFILWTFIKIDRIAIDGFWNDSQFDIYKKNWK